MTVAFLAARRTQSSADPPRANVVAILILITSVAAGAALTALVGNPIPLIVLAVVGVVLMQAPRIAQQWERAVVLRLGKFVGLRGPGLFWIVPFIDTVSSWIDQRTITTSFAAEQTLTSDTVPVNVDAVLFWMVHDAQKAALEVQEYAQAVSWAAQTALRDIIGRTDPHRSAARAREDRGGAAAAHRRAVEPVGRHRVVGRDARRRDPRRAAGRHVARGAGGAREAGAHHPRRGGAGDRALVRGSSQGVSQQPDRAAPARDEHALRRAEGKGRDDDHSEQRRRVDGHGRTDGRRGDAAAATDHQRRMRSKAT